MKKNILKLEGIKSLKKRISEYFTSTDWPWEIMGGLFVTLLVINYFSPHFTQEAGTAWIVLRAILNVNLFWALIESFLFIFTSLLYRGHYNTKIATIRSADDESAADLIRAELEESIISVADEKTKQSIVEALRKEFITGQYNKSRAVAFLRNDALGALWVFFFAMLPSVALLTILILMPNIYWAVAISNIIGIIVFFAFGYKLATCTNRNKVATGIAVAIAGSMLVAAGMLLGA
jgi:hypothetical protein